MKINRDHLRGAKSHKGERSVELVAHQAAEWIIREASPQSLITVTRALSQNRGQHFTVFVSIFPIDQIRPALNFLERSRGDFRDYLATHSKLRPLPTIAFQLDDGELNRQRLDELSRGPGGN